MFSVSLRDAHSCCRYSLSFLHSSEDDDDWCPPLPARTYLMDTSREELSSLPSKPDEPSYTATLTSSPQRDTHKPSESPRLQHFDLLARHQSGSQVSQSNPDVFTNAKAQEADEVYHTRQWAEDFRGESLGKGQFEFSLLPPVFRSDFPRGGAQPHSVMYNLVYGVT